MPVAPFFIEKSSKRRFFGIKIVKIMIFCAKVVNMTTLIGLKWAHKQLILISTKDFDGSRGPRGRQDCERVSEPRGLGGGRGRVNPPPRRLVWRFWEVSRVCRSVATSTRFEAQGLGGLMSHPFINACASIHRCG